MRTANLTGNCRWPTSENVSGPIYVFAQVTGVNQSRRYKVLIDCDTCRMRDIACGDCVISLLLGAPEDSQDLDRRRGGCAWARWRPVG